MSEAVAGPDPEADPDTGGGPGARLAVTAEDDCGVPPAGAATELVTEIPLPLDRDKGFEVLYRREYEPMVRLAVLLVGRDGPAQEAVHDSFARVYERWAKVDNPGGYLRTTLVNRCRDVQRRRFLERKREAAAQPLPPSELGALELVDALDKLAPKRRAALVLRFYADMSEGEIAVALGVPRGTVKSLVSRGLADLRKVVEP